MHRKCRLGERGSAAVEFALVSVFIIPLLMGSFVVGMNLGRFMQASQVSRDGGHMYARSVDFSQPANQDLIVRLARGLKMTRTGGEGVVIFSTVLFVGAAQCTGAGLSIGDCTNVDQNVFIRRIVVGNAALRASGFGTPNPGLLNSRGDVSNYLTDVSARANGFSAVLALQPGEFAYLSEAYFASPDFDLPGFRTGTGVYVRSIF